jgi:CubicO group peptidase (beta-lactamase class C family)
MWLKNLNACVCWVCCLLAMSAAAADVPAGTNTTASMLEAIRTKRELPGLAVVVIKNGKICDRAAVGVRKLGDSTPLTTNDQFHIGSCTKAMTATVAAMLIEEGKLRWDTTIVDVFPEWKGKMDPQYEKVTVEQLMTHRGGLPEKAPLEPLAKAQFQHGSPTQQRLEFLQAVLAAPPQAPPGTKYIYSNQGYATLGAMLEKLSGKPYEDLMTERLFRPLHMDSAGFGPPGTEGKVDQPWGHAQWSGSKVPTQFDNPPAIAPAGRVHCSLDDMARYVIAHLEGERDGGLLKPETFRHLHTPPEGADYACGWRCVQRSWAGGKALTHAGSNTFWLMVLWLAPEKDFAIITATNIFGDPASKACDEAAVEMMHKWLGK